MVGQKLFPLQFVLLYQSDDLGFVAAVLHLLHHFEVRKHSDNLLRLLLVRIGNLDIFPSFRCIFADQRNCWGRPNDLENIVIKKNNVMLLNVLLYFLIASAKKFILSATNLVKNQYLEN